MFLPLSRFALANAANLVKVRWFSLSNSNGNIHIDLIMSYREKAARLERTQDVKPIRRGRIQQQQGMGLKWPMVVFLSLVYGSLIKPIVMRIWQLLSLSLLKYQSEFVFYIVKYIIE